LKIFTKINITEHFFIYKTALHVLHTHMHVTHTHTNSCHICSSTFFIPRALLTWGQQTWRVSSEWPGRGLSSLSAALCMHQLLACTVKAKITNIFLLTAVVPHHVPRGLNTAKQCVLLCFWP